MNRVSLNKISHILAKRSIILDLGALLKQNKKRTLSRVRMPSKTRIHKYGLLDVLKYEQGVWCPLKFL
jgi:hypothetical protein